MKLYHAYKMVITVVLLLSTLFLSGCIKRLSDPIPTPAQDYTGVVAVDLANYIGKVDVLGTLDRVDSVAVDATLRVETYSLFGLGNPNNYLETIDAVEQVENGVLTLRATVVQRSFMDRLFVRVLPHVEYFLEVPTGMDADITLDVGNIDVTNLVGDVSGSVRVGELTGNFPLGIFGEQNYQVSVGALTLSLAENTGFRYDLKTSVGSIDSTGMDMAVHGVIGAAASGVVGVIEMPPSSITGRVNVGSIDVSLQ